MATMLAALGESIVLAEAVDLSVPDLLEILYVETLRYHKYFNPSYFQKLTDNLTRSLGAMNNPMFGLKGPKMQHGTKGYDTNFPLEHAQKDIRFAQLLGDEHGVSMSVSSAANGMFLHLFRGQAVTQI